MLYLGEAKPKGSQSMADSFLEASPTNGEDRVRLESGGSSDEEYERMTAAEVLEKLEEVRGGRGLFYTPCTQQTSMLHYTLGMDQ